MDLSKIKGVGPAARLKLEKLNITTPIDLLYHFPSRYVDRRKYLKIADLVMITEDNWHSTGEIKKLSTFRIPGGRMMANGVIEDDTGSIKVQWFNNPYLMSNYKIGDKVIFSGKPEKGKITNPKLRKFTNEEDVAEFGKIEAIYPETRGLKSNQINKYIYNFLYTNPEVKENLPQTIIKAEKLISRIEAIKELHFPESIESMTNARERIAFEEIYSILKLIQKRKASLKKFKSPANKINLSTQAQLEAKLNFKFTESQQESIKEIFEDISKEKPMHRLLNGDVGSGKTIVALSVAFQVLNNNRQVIFLAPTSVLAKQHFDLTNNLLSDFNIKVHLVTSDNRAAINKLKSEINDENNQEIFIGTHALLFQTELFKNIGLVIIDEQHKFGVKQRELLESFIHQFPRELENANHTKHHLSSDLSSKVLRKEKALVKEERSVAHVLSMSATPIPRSLALTIFGDLDVSILKKPVERKKIITKVIYDEETQMKMYEWIRNQVKNQKAQAYIVCPLIQDSEILDTKSAISEFENLKNVFKEFNVEILHGKIKPKIKDNTLSRFKNGQIDILVSTSVIEVGIDNPNACIMVIEGAERFGLAQLHQIRGRVGRSEKQSYCFLKSTRNENDERLNFFANENDGFKIAEYDLVKRGPGEVYGEAQSGIPNLKVAKITDIELIKRVRKYFK